MNVLPANGRTKHQRTKEVQDMRWRTWDPFAEFEVLRRDLERRLADYGDGGRLRTAFLPGLSARAYPLTNIYEDAEALHVEALAPGLDADSIDVSIERSVLTMSGRKKTDENVRPDQYHRSERAGGRFTRALTLRTEVDPEKVEANYENGILHIRLPKHERAKARQVSIHVK
jgi:HSP20 family protein